MRFLQATVLICLFFLSYYSTQAVGNQYPNNSILYQIENEYLDGNISLDDKVILQVNSIKFPDKLPLKYTTLSQAQTETISDHEYRSATLALLQIRTSWENLEEDTKNYVSFAMARMATAFTYISPGGYFKLHYDTLGDDSVPTADLDLNSIPDFVEKCAAYCDSSLAKHLELGYLPPPSDGVIGGDSLYDIYFEEMSDYGYAYAEGFGDQSWNDYYSYIVLNNDFIGFAPNTDPEGNVAGAAKATIAHEFQHAVQFGYDASEGFWVYESCATLMEEVVFDAVNDNYGYLDDFLDYPHSAITDNGGLHKYGTFIWQLYLAQKFDTLLHVSAWEGARYHDILTTYNDTLLSNFGWTLDSAYVDFTYWIFNTGWRDDGLHFNEGSDYYPLTVSGSHISYPIGITNSPASISGYGAGYVTFFPGSEIGKLKLKFNGSNTRNWSAYIIKSSSPNSHEIEFISLDTINENGEIIIEEFESYYSVTLVGANLDELSSSVLFTYSAEILLPFEVSSLIQSPVDSFVYSGGSRTFEILVRNDAVIPDVFNLIYWDAQGWLPKDTYAFAVPALDSQIVYVDVNPPQGTPLGEISLLSFKAESWGDTTVFDIQTRIGQISLYRGDFDFSGAIDISDIVGLISYSFNGGASPQPVPIASDFDCSGDLDISDIVGLVAYMFSGGASSPCNPY